MIPSPAEGTLPRFARGWQVSPALGLWLVRGLWLVVFLIIVTLYTVYFPARWSHLTTSDFAEVSRWQRLHATDLARLQNLGISSQLYYSSVIFCELVSVGVYTTVALVIAYRRFRDPTAMLISAAMISFGGTTTSYALALEHAVSLTYWPIEALQAFNIAMTLITPCIFPNGRCVPGWSRALVLVAVVLMAFWLIVPSAPFNFSNGFTSGIYSYLLGIMLNALAATALVRRFREHATLIERQQIKWAVFGMLVVSALAPLRFGLIFALPVLGLPADSAVYLLFDVGQRPLFSLVLTIIPTCFAIALLRYRLWNIDPLISRVLVYGTLSVLLATTYAISVIGIGALLQLVSGRGGTLAVAAATLLTAAVARPLRDRLQATIDRRFDRTRVDFQSALPAFIRDVHTLIALPELLQFLLTRSTELLKIAHGAVFLQVDGRFSLAAGHQLPADAPRQLPAELVAQLRPGAALTRPADPIFPLLLPLLAWRSGRSKLTGALALGPRRSEQPYSLADQALLLSLVDQAGTAISVAQLVEVERQLADFRTSPVGRAEAFAIAVATVPATTLEVIHSLARRANTNPDQAALLAALPQALHSVGQAAAATLADGYRYLIAASDTPELLVTGVRMIRNALDVPPAEGWDHAPEGRRIYAATGDALNARSMAQIARWPQFQITADHFVELAEVLAALWPVTRAMQAVSLSQTPTERVTELERGRVLLQQVIHRALTTLVEPERRLVAAIGAQCEAVMSTALQTIQGQASLELRLLTRHVVPAEVITFVLELRNLGHAPATELTVTLLPGDSYTLLSAEAAVALLTPGQSATVTLRVRLEGQVVLDLDLVLRYSDSSAMNHTRRETLSATILQVPSYNGEIPNDYQPGQPLQANSPIFFGRGEDLQFIREALQPTMNGALVITGERRMGKTSLLCQLVNRLGPAYAAVYLDMQGLAIDPGMDGFFADLATVIAAGLQIEAPPPELFARRPAAAFASNFLPRAIETARPRRLVLLLDEFEELEARVNRGKLDRELFSLLRHLMQHQSGLSLVFVGTHQLEELNPAYWSVFFNAALHRRIGCLDEAAATALITEPVAGRLCYDDLAVDRMLRASGGNPYFLQLLCQRLVANANNEQRSFIAPEHISASIEQVVLAGWSHLASLWNEADAVERALLGQLAGDTESGTRSVRQLARSLRTATEAPGEAAIEAALKRLVRRDMLLLVPAAGLISEDQYGWRLLLLRHWIQRAIPAL